MKETDREQHVGIVKEGCIGYMRCLSTEGPFYWGKKDRRSGTEMAVEAEV